MKTLKLDISKAGVEITPRMEERTREALSLLYSKQGAGNDFLGWVTLPSSIAPQELSRIEAEAKKLRECADVIICIGIGGSYLGAKAVAEAMGDSFAALRPRKEPVVVFAGQNLSEEYTYELLDAVKDHSIAAIVISKSGTTTEPAVAFRIVKAEIERRYGKAGAAERIALKTLADNEGYATFVIPDDVGGRFSVLTPVGLLPLAAAGVDIEALVRGAEEMERATGEQVAFAENPAVVYATVRNALYEAGKKIEILGSYEPKLQYINEWWKQLYGESEGKDGKGLFPASVTLTADLHSMGQYIQEGERTMFETIVSVTAPKHEVRIESDAENLDGLNYLAGKRLSEVNRMAELGVQLAHVDGEKIEWHYHPCGNQLGVSNGLGDDYQMRVYSPSDYGDGYVYANVWAWDALWGSVLYTDNGPNAVAGRPMARIESYDKAYKECCDRSNSKPGNLAKEEFKPDTNVKHLFRIKPSDGATSCTVEVTDRFGRRYSASLDWDSASTSDMAL